MEQWTVKRILDWISGFLAEHGDENPLLSAQWLVSDALGMSRIQLYADYDRPLSPEERAVLRDYTKRRAAGEPLQYITGTTDFRFITVHVEPGVLIPRPETEVLVSEALAEARAVRAEEDVERAEADELEGAAGEAGREDASTTGAEADASVAGLAAPRAEAAAAERAVAGGRGSDAGAGAEDPDAETAAGEDAQAEAEREERPWRVVDLCTGTGCIACSIATEVPGSLVRATDIDPKAVDLARRNAKDLGVEDRLEVLEGDLADPVGADWDGTADLVISNPPYVPSGLMASLDRQVSDFEPARALDGGADGLDLYRRILPQAQRLLRPNGVLAVELHEDALGQAAALARAAGFAHVRIAQDLAGRDRVLVARAR